ncbi:putative phytase [Coleophoma cylindrospora]|uniref:Putative phytase n=1 Tax=Coleophoma cylindrospora TaxID=1849047 RepID=A0A3D8R6Q7_9HELO|nr:putative phytase [Coleophoma cylindrospora]
MGLSSLFVVALATAVNGVHAAHSASEPELLKDITQISTYWGEMATYYDNPEDYFGVEYVGLPDGCQVESVQNLQRHGERFAITYIDDGLNNARFVEKITNYTSAANTSALFTGPLTFLNTYQSIMDNTGLLTGLGASAEFKAGVSFWNKYGRTLFGASNAQLSYNATFLNGTARPKITLRTTSQARIQNSQINWALGFFGPTYQAEANPTLANATSDFDVVIIAEGGTENDTLASYDSCPQSGDSTIAYLGDFDVFQYIPKYLGAATARLNKYAPAGFQLTTNDTYAMQDLCAYEQGYIGMSDFCNMFTADEWAGFENTLDMAYYYDYAWGNPTGRAQGIGYLQELLARLNSTHITSSQSSVNSTLDDNDTTFPLNQKTYVDFSHDDIIISVLTAMSFDYLREPPSLSQFPPNPERHFILSHLTPFGARLFTETIGCSSPDPAPVKDSRVHYTPTQYGYDASNATFKFVRMRLNDGILPLNTIRGGACGNATSGRVDGMCSLEKFLESQAESDYMANYQYACFGNYTVENATSGYDYDGTIGL